MSKILDKIQSNLLFLPKIDKIFQMVLVHRSYNLDNMTCATNIYKIYMFLKIMEHELISTYI